MKLRPWIVLNLILLASCATESIDENSPASLFKDAESEISSDHYQIAIDKLKVIKNKFPYSSQAIEAHLRIADVYFLQESYAEAASVYETFRDLHPKHPKTPYAMYRIAKSFLNDTPSPIARDITSASKSLDAYNDLIRKYPSAPEVVEAKKDLLQIEELLAEKEFYIGNFYFIRDYYDSAKPRFEKILRLYPGVETAKRASERLAAIERITSGGDHGASGTQK